jgi:hypothetical protein
MESTILTRSISIINTNSTSDLEEQSQRKDILLDNLMSKTLTNTMASLDTLKLTTKEWFQTFTSSMESSRNAMATISEILEQAKFKIPEFLLVRIHKINKMLPT